MEIRRIDLFDHKVRQSLRKDAKDFLANMYQYENVAEDMQVKLYTNSKEVMYFIIPDMGSPEQLKDIIAGVKVNSGTVGTAGSVGSFSTLASVCGSASSMGTASTGGTVGTSKT